MQRKTKILLASGTVAVVLLALGGAGYAHHTHCMEGRDGHGHGGRGHGYHAGMMHGGGMMMGQRDRDLTEAEIRTVAEAFLLVHGNDRLKIGAITEGGNSGYLVHLVTQDDSPVMEVELDKRTGRPLHGEGRHGKGQQARALPNAG